MTDYTEPILPGRGASDYERYLRTDELLALQKRPEEMVHRDELLFQTVHQSSELWMKLAGFEVEAATERLAAGNVSGAVRLLRRATECLTLITRQLHMLEHLSPWEYQTIRKVLGHGSGFDSPGFLHLHRLAGPLGHAFGARLAAAGLDAVSLYQRAHDVPDLYDAAEQLIGFDEGIILWRFHHFQVVQRIIGAHVIGTQGTPVEVLGKRIQVHLFPDLWAARDRLTELGRTEREDTQDRR